MPVDPHYQPKPLLDQLGEGFHDAVEAARFPELRLRFRNQRWAERIGLGGLDAEEWEAHLGRLEPLPANIDPPLALRYHGHQFGMYNPGLGDGRGFLHAQLVDAVDGRLLDLGTKGSGQTPWSRGGDGRLTLKGGVREVLATEMLEALGVYTSKTLSLFETGESLERYDEPSPTRAAIMVRLSHGHVRFGSFQRHAHDKRPDRIAALLEYAAARLVPVDADAEPLPVAFLREVTRRTAALAAQWMAAGFVHGVLNTDNMSVTGESFDYGPYRFLPEYDPHFTAAYFDQTGLYAYGRQPQVGLWNLEQLATALAHIHEPRDFEAVLADYEPLFQAAFRERFLERLGVESRGAAADDALVEAGFAALARTQVPFDAFFFDWYGGEASRVRALSGRRSRVYAGREVDAFLAALGERAATHPERLADPYYQGDEPCSMLIDEIEAIWSDIAERDDWTAFEAKVEACRARGRLHGVEVEAHGEAERDAAS